jgi:hypothetical protein
MLIDDVERIIHTAPGLTATQIARKLYGIHGYGERVRAACQMLHHAGRIERTGQGGPGDPYRFHPASDATASSARPGKASGLSFAEISVGRTAAGRMRYWGHSRIGAGPE